MSLRRRLITEWFAITVFACLLAVLALNWRGTESFDYLFYDQLSALGRPVPDEKTVIVAIDDASLQKLGRFPWSRDVHARLLARLEAYQPRSITLDVIFSEPSLEKDDAALSDAMGRGAPVLLPVHFPSPGLDGQPYDFAPPIAPLKNAAAALGHVNLDQDSDGIVRRIMLCFDPGPTLSPTPHLMEQVYRNAHAGKPSGAYLRQKCGDLALIPYSESASYVTISYADLLNSEVPSTLLKGRDILVGATAPGLGDNYPVPFADGGVMPGIEIMANVLGAIKRDSFILPLSRFLVTIVTLIPIVALMLLFLRLQPRHALIASLGAIAALLLGSAAALKLGYWFPPGAAFIGILIAYPLWGWRRLQAVSDFMETEIADLEKRGEAAPFVFGQKAPPDLIGQQSAALANSIDNIRDLRRFVTEVIKDMPDPMVVVDKSGKIIMSSDLAAQRSGQSLIGLPINAAMKAAVVPADWPAVREYLVRPHDAARDQDFTRFLAVTGQTFVMRRSPIETDEKELLGSVYYLADISALSAAEDERERILSLLSHDMRAPQSAIIAALSGQLDDDAKNRIERNARRTMQLAQDFVEMSRMSETPFEGAEVLLVQMVSEVVDGFYYLAKEAEVSVEVIDKSREAFVLAEPDLLARALANLLDNAIKFSPAGGRISILLKKQKLGEAAHVSLCITDEGTGIDPDILPRLFTRFATHDKARRRAKGTGLGLSFVEAVAIRHSGKIEAGNVRGKGARFCLYLPEASPR